MGDSSHAVLYLRLKRRIYIKPEQTVSLKQVARLLTDDHEMEEQLNGIVLYKHCKADGNRVVIDLLQIVKSIRQLSPDMTVEAYGDPQVLIMVSEKPVKPRYVVLVLAWLLLFFGAGLAVMNFHTDVNMKDVHIRIVELITGEREDHPLWFQIPYSIGIGLGMVLFFNHIFKKRFNEEPNPLEVELFRYQENVNDYVIADEMRKKNHYNQQDDGPYD
ncbi:stage V sporulation protein AA [Paenibacillus sp. GSMTC-2017]|uniref:stage V sporulation protein AA n=1 Tax=Paenibacillus sp. GSMTC-2017 TaxID=2794350 RepID=UPI0018D903B3|nr:stage V sporulation protein AA [Paenibacillus sp. GSMTC-2017]MBH5318016.1 stage V sporulation protein AA [Paenibacillus sp. GSMTC-2017]